MPKNILFILPWLPYPLKSGGHQAIFNGIKAVVDDYNVFITYDKNENDEDSTEQKNLAKALDHTITILPFTRKLQKEKQSFLFRCYIKFWDIKERIKRTIGLAKERHATSFFKIEINNNRVLFINNLIESHHIDIVQCEMVSSLSDVLILPSYVNKIYVQHQIDYVRCKLDLEEQNLFSKYKDLFSQSKQSEIFLLNHFDKIIALSNYDKSLMEQDGVVVPISVSPAITTTEPKPHKKSTAKKLLTFIGPSMHYPNVYGISWFLKKCWNQLKALDKEFRLQIIGEWDDSVKKNILKHFTDVEFCGFVPDLPSKIANTIMIVPINIGSGIRMKILEAISNGVPVVSTSIGAQGLPLEDNKDCFITDNPQTFVEDILLLKDESKRDKIILNAQKKISAEYSLAHLKKTRLSIYNTENSISRLD